MSDPQSISSNGGVDSKNELSADLKKPSSPKEGRGFSDLLWLAWARECSTSCGTPPAPPKHPVVVGGGRPPCAAGGPASTTGRGPARFRLAGEKHGFSLRPAAKPLRNAIPEIAFLTAAPRAPTVGGLPPRVGGVTRPSPRKTTSGRPRIRTSQPLVAPRDLGRALAAPGGLYVSSPSSVVTPGTPYVSFPLAVLAPW